MTGLEQLGILDELVNNFHDAKANEFRAPLISLREAFVACEKMGKEYAEFKITAAKEKADIAAKYEELKMRHLELNPPQNKPTPDSNWPRGGTGFKY